MVLYRSREPDVEVRDDQTIWTWLFESKETSPLYAPSTKPLGAFVDAETEERIDYAQLKEKCTALSTTLIGDYGLCPGDTISVFSPNTIWYPVCMFALLRAGARINGASPGLTVDEMAYALRVVKSKLVITVPSSLDRALEAAAQVGIPASHVLLIQGQVDGCKSIQDLIREGEGLEQPLPYQLPAGTSNKELCGFLNLSSGTTGLPKAVMISHHNVIANCTMMQNLQADKHHFKLLAVLPCYHITGLWRFCHFPIFLNGEAIMLSAYSLPGMLKAFVRFQIEEVALVPPILLRLARDPIVNEYDLSCMQRWTSGAAPLSPEILKEVQVRFPWISFRQGYGATEAAIIAAHPKTHWDWKYGAAVGMLIPNTRAKVIDTATGEELGPGQTGELLVTGPQVAMGYLDNEKANSQSYTADGFYKTGDLGYFDGEGLIYIKDRIKEMIKVKGYQVAPAELEDLLLGHDDVGDCAVISIPDEYSGELPKAFVVLKPDCPWSEVSGRRLLDYVCKNKVRYKWLAEVEFVDKIPKSPTGKLLRRVLKDREMARQRGEPPADGVREGYRVRR